MCLTVISDRGYHRRERTLHRRERAETPYWFSTERGSVLIARAQQKCLQMERKAIAEVLKINTVLTRFCFGRNPLGRHYRCSLFISFHTR